MTALPWHCGLGPRTIRGGRSVVPPLPVGLVCGRVRTSSFPRPRGVSLPIGCTDAAPWPRAITLVSSSSPAMAPRPCSSTGRQRRRGSAPRRRSPRRTDGRASAVFHHASRGIVSRNVPFHWSGGWFGVVAYSVCASSRRGVWPGRDLRMGRRCPAVTVLFAFIAFGTRQRNCLPFFPFPSSPSAARSLERRVGRRRRRRRVVVTGAHGPRLARIIDISDNSASQGRSRRIYAQPSACRGNGHHRRLADYWVATGSRTTRSNASWRAVGGSDRYGPTAIECGRSRPGGRRAGHATLGVDTDLDSQVSAISPPRRRASSDDRPFLPESVPPAALRTPSEFSG